jgi:hypothetical protein
VLSISRPGICVATCKVIGIVLLKDDEKVEVSFVEHYVGTSYWKSYYMRCRCCNGCRTKQGGKTKALWEIAKYNRMYNLTNEVLHKPELI